MMNTLDDRSVSECIYRYLKSVEALDSLIRASSKHFSSSNLVPRIQHLHTSLKELNLECSEFTAAPGRCFPRHTAEAFNTILSGIEDTTQLLTFSIRSWPMSSGWDPDKVIEVVELRLEAVETLRRYVQRQLQSYSSFGFSHGIDEEKAARREKLENTLRLLLQENSISVVGLEYSDASRLASNAPTSTQSPSAWTAELSAQPFKMRLDFVLLRLAQWRAARSTYSTGAFNRGDATKLLTKLVHCGLATRSLMLYQDQERSKALWEEISDILVEATVEALDHLRTKKPSLQVDPRSCLTEDFNIAGTLEEISPTALLQEAHQFEYSPTEPLHTWSTHQESSSQQIPLSLDPLEISNSGSGSSHTADSSSSSLSTDKLHVALKIASLPIESHDRSESQITVERDDFHATIDVSAANGQFKSAEPLDISVAELIPYYTFDGGPLVLWFRHPNKDPVLLYFAEECNKANLLDFHGFFMRRKLAGNYQNIESIKFDGKDRRDSRTCDSRPTVQIWDVPQTSTFFSDSPLSSTRTFGSQSSFTSQNSRNVAAIGAPVEASRIFFFGDTCIWAMSINDDVSIEPQKSQTLQILPKKSKDHLKIQAIIGNIDRPAGIPLAVSQPHNRKLTDFRSIDMKFLTKDAFRTFVKGFEESQENWKRRRSSIEQTRRVQNTNIIESRSSFKIR